jgi:hypothetical protein
MCLATRRNSHFDVTAPRDEEGNPLLEQERDPEGNEFCLQ